MARRTGTDEQHPVEAVNEVRLRGRLSAGTQERELPSGDSMLLFRLVVEREASSRSGGARHDTIDCVAFSAAVRRKVLRWGSGDVVEVAGSLRRRFFVAGGARASRYDVEARSVDRVALAPVRPARASA